MVFPTVSLEPSLEAITDHEPANQSKAYRLLSHVGFSVQVHRKSTESPSAGLSF